MAAGASTLKTAVCRAFHSHVVILAASGSSLSIDERDS